MFDAQLNALPVLAASGRVRRVAALASSLLRPPPSAFAHGTPLRESISDALVTAVKAQYLFWLCLLCVIDRLVLTFFSIQS